jgi:hypothetical protein
MPDPSTTEFLRVLNTTYRGRVRPYGTSSAEEHGTGFQLAGVDATFSVLTHGGSLPPGRYDVQIESDPPGNFLYTAEHSMTELLELIERIDRGEWPTTGGASGFDLRAASDPTKPNQV